MGRDDRDALAACIRRAGKQYGNISRAQARKEGLSPGAMARDRDKQNLYGLLGWRCYHVTAARLRGNPGGVLGQIAEFRELQTAKLSLGAAPLPDH